MRRQRGHGVYWNNPRLNLFNYNGSVTKGWEQVRKNRESSYPEIKDVKLDVRDVSVTMLGTDWRGRYLPVDAVTELQRHTRNRIRPDDARVQACRHGVESDSPAFVT